MSILKKIHFLFVSLFVTLLSAPWQSALAQSVSVVEFYSKSLDAYFITGRQNEQQSLDGLSDFKRTGMSFDALPASSPATGKTRICRFYINLTAPFTSSHFYGREAIDCDQIQAQRLPGFSYEGFDFAVAEPKAGVCAAGTKPIYRGFRTAAGGKTANHRYTASLETYNIAQSEGYAAEQAVFCAASVTDVLPTIATVQKCGTFYYPGKRISYQSLSTTGTADGSQRFLNTYNEPFNGQPDATAVVALFGPNAPPQLTMITNGAATWTLLGTSVLYDSGPENLYYANPPAYLRDYLPGQAVLVNSQLTYSKANTFGNVLQSGGVTYIGQESVAVPLGKYLSACKFATQLITTFSGTGETTTSSTIDWVADGLGIVKTIRNTETTSPSNPASRATTTTEAVFVQSF